MQGNFHDHESRTRTLRGGRRVAEDGRPRRGFARAAAMGRACTELGSKMKSLVKIGLILLCVSCDDTPSKYDCASVHYSNGAWLEQKTNHPANGTWKCVEFRDGSLHETTMELRDGRQVETWSYYVDEVLIHHGRIVSDSAREVIDSATAIVEASYVEIDSWYEGSWHQLVLRVLEPKGLDDSTANNRWATRVILPLKQHFHMNHISVEVGTRGEWRYVNELPPGRWLGVKPSKPAQGVLLVR